jgi:hypothetical protein
LFVLLLCPVLDYSFSYLCLTHRLSLLFLLAVPRRSGFNMLRPARPVLGMRFGRL